MGLTLGVGWLSEAVRLGDEAEIESRRRSLGQLNDVLVEAGLAPHEEPTDIGPGWERDMWGYSGLHTVRRLAAYKAIEDRPAPPRPDDWRVAEDPMLRRLYALNGGEAPVPARGWLSRLSRRSAPKPGFHHLVCHSDCEGFYVPRDFADVVYDLGDPPRYGLGGMVGSSQRLLTECQVLAGLIGLPLDADPDDDQLLDAAETRSAGGPSWRRHGVEALSLALLMQAARLSIARGAVLAFS